ncbi:DUF2520 domain-containing protein, partial [bacterium]|nr:DUF2520 domain-containing protein [bacterium]
AACILSNSLAPLFSLSTSIMVNLGIDPDDAQDALCTLLGSSFLNLVKSDPAEALTGPVSRGDIETIKKHLKALSEYDEEVKSLYIKIGKLTMEFADIIGADKAKLAIIEREFDTHDR